MRTSKTDFIQFLHCPKSLWLLKHKPDKYPHGEFSDYAKKIAEEGYEVEEQAQALVGAQSDATAFSFQNEFITARGLYARADIIRKNADGTINIYEVKSSTSVKRDAKHDQIKDATFQKIVAEETGLQVAKVYIVHLNKEYVRDGTVDPKQLLVFADVTDEVNGLIGETSSQIDDALDLLSRPEIDEGSCSCISLTKSNHCDTFEYFNQCIPAPSIYDLPRITRAKVSAFTQMGRFSLDEIELDEVTEKQSFVLKSAQSRAPVIERAALSKFFSQAEYPIYFLDYETYSSAIPIVDGARPQAPIPFQYSLHIKRTPNDTQLVHVEYLAEEAAMPLQLIEHMEAHIGEIGSVVSWHASFENTQNKSMADLYPRKSDFLFGLIRRTLDLEDIFKDGYVDIAFGGSTSIKKVLPVLAPDLDYANMAVSNGTEAMESWVRLINLPDSPEKDKLRKDMLEYCKLDTYAMVRIFEEIERKT
ncbi:DUF2779 domain-containing protein [Ruegeria conchae]|uniref:DUF2779 domain-containing protein n=1 Tax=Ruegeria conchae TaxID=981384 RepID=UPI0021A2EB46|nr:DUF2779 domain-containing protein [Ruegeria conchae]UWR03468.1 DUF2779 domain-containing protein [Ruegeria conchae]